MADKKRFAVGVKVRVSRPGMNGIITQVNDEPTILGEYWHSISTDRRARREPGSNLEPIAITNE